MGLYPLLRQQFCQNAGVHIQRGLRDAGLAQFVFGAFKTDRGQVEAQYGGGFGVAAAGQIEVTGKILAHADDLRSLAGV